MCAVVLGIGAGSREGRGVREGGDGREGGSVWEVGGGEDGVGLVASVITRM